ncbi:hypothetical protein BN1723_019485, partial [Verticillium longisporum]
HHQGRRCDYYHARKVGWYLP